MQKSKHDTELELSNIIISKNVVLKKLDKSLKKKSNIGSKLNKAGKDLSIDFKEKIKILKKAKKEGHFTLFSFVKVYRKNIKISYEFIHKKIKNDDEFAYMLKNEGILIRKINAQKTSNKEKTYTKYYISADTTKRKEFLRICAMLTKQYQKEVFIKDLSNSL